MFHGFATGRTGATQATPPEGAPSDAGPGRRRTDRLRSGFRRLLLSRKGATAVLVAGIAPALIGVAGLATETGLWYSTKRSAQIAADAAAQAAAMEILGSRSGTVATQGQAEATRAGFQNGVNGTTVTVTTPPTAGAYAGNNKAVSVTVTRSMSLLFVDLFRNTPVSVAATATAAVVGSGTTSGTGCILAKDTSASNAIQISGNATVSLPGCTMVSNSSSASSISLNGNITLTAQSLRTVGNWTKSGNITTNFTAAPTTGASPTSDPYSSLALPTLGACNFTNTSYTSGTRTINPGTYCNGLSLSGNAKVTMAPGVYVINGGDFSAAGNVQITGSGVTIIFNAQNSTSIGRINWSGNLVIDLTAPSSGSTAGILVQQSSLVAYDATNKVHKFSGNSNMKLKGAIVVPNQAIEWVGNTGAGASDCTVLVARTIKFVGNSSMKLDGCAALGTTPVSFGSGGGTVKIVE